jgi:hypothetical protein
MRAVPLVVSFIKRRRAPGSRSPHPAQRRCWPTAPCRAARPPPQGRPDKPGAAIPLDRLPSINQPLVGVVVRAVSPAANQRPEKFRECAETEQIRGLSAEPGPSRRSKARKFRCPESIRNSSTCKEHPDPRNAGSSDPSFAAGDTVLTNNPGRSGSTARCTTTRCLRSVRALWGDWVRTSAKPAFAVPSQQRGAACWVCAAAALALSGRSRMPSSIAGCAGRGRRPRCGWLRLSWRGFA